MPSFTTRPVVRGTRGVVSSGHYLASSAGLRVMAQGGNAIDAAAAMSFCLNILEPHLNGIAGEVPTLVHSAREKRTYAVSGLGWSPRAFTIDWCRAHGIDLIPGDGYLPMTVPAPVGTWTTVVARWGNLSFGEVLLPAIELAENGYPVYEGLHAYFSENLRKFTEQYPSAGAVYCPGGRAPEVGALIRNPAWADTLKKLCDAEREAAGKGRVAGIEAARDCFYEGEIADRILDFISTQAAQDASGSARTALMSAEDLRDWRAEVEDPVSYSYQGLDVHKCSGWTQGPVFVQQLALLSGYDLRTMGHNSTEYLHTLIECAKLAFLDREAYYGDPKFGSIPFDVLLSEAYNAGRRAQIGDRASTEWRPGDVGAGIPAYALEEVVENNRKALSLGPGEIPDAEPGHGHESDTTHLDAVDAEGNMVAATPSGGWIGSSPLIPDVGFPMGTRGQMFYLNAERPNALAGRKRPRATLTPSLATRRGEPYLAFGTPGGDTQDQTALQFFLNFVVFGMNVQEALDAPIAYSTHFPSSFYPRKGFPGEMVAEDRIPEAVIEGLKQRGHTVRMVDGWSAGKVMGIHYETETGVLSGGASPRKQIGYAMGW